MLVVNWAPLGLVIQYSHSSRYYIRFLIYRRGGMRSQRLNNLNPQISEQVIQRHLLLSAL